MSVIVDDQNPRIFYSGDWSQTTNVKGAYNSTLTSGVAAGSYFEFEFTGTAVYVYGSIKANSTDIYANFTVDNFPFETRQLFNTGSVNGNGIQFYSLGGFNTTQSHTLAAIILEASDAQPLEVDFIAYDPPANATISSASSTSLPSPTGSSPLIEVQIGSKTPVGAIVGGVVGGVGGLLIIGVLLFWFLWRRRSRGGQAYFYRPADAADMLDQEIKPFEPPSAPPTTIHPAFPHTPSVTSGTSALYPPAPGSDIDTTSSYTAGSGQPFAQRTQSFAVMSQDGSSEAGGSSFSGTGRNGPRVYSSPNQAYSKAAEAGLLSVANTPATYHADSGVRFNAGGAGPSGGSHSAVQANSAIQEEDAIADVPPEYSEN